ncbi:unnamed protein product [Psylliodes chrysocephalus]|uniref:Uncharacterized protein n=1 Tax=Psylliodes chrysocephalus TaxID=3402493 RepID=A0A9P0CSV8_9CUCU|nr:unnamed protein product [Psylliodes chrysocephala]
MGEENSRRLSQNYDPLTRLGELTRLLPRRLRDAHSVLPPPLAAFDVLDGQGGSGSNGTVNWQERCLELQLELHRSRTQATRTRDMLREKEINSEAPKINWPFAKIISSTHQVFSTRLHRVFDIGVRVVVVEEIDNRRRAYPNREFEEIG